MSIYRLDVSIIMGFEQAIKLKKYIKEIYGANATILKIEEDLFLKND